MPLYDEDRIQIHTRLSEPLFIYVLAMTSAGEIRVLYPTDASVPAPEQAVSIPAGRDEWLPLTPPGGVETILLLARRDRLDNPAALTRSVRALGPVPAFNGVGMLVADDAGVRFAKNADATHRAVGDAPLVVNKGLLAALMEKRSDSWLAVRAISFTHVSEGVSGPTTSRVDRE